MSSTLRERDRKRLEQEIRGESYQVLFQKIQRKDPFFLRFNTWADVVTLMRGSKSQNLIKDQILRSIFRIHHEDQDSRWQNILLISFWPGLELIHWQKRHWDPNEEERWQNIIWAFLKTFSRINTEKRPHRLVQKIFYDTVHYLYDEYRCARNHKEWEVLTNSEEVLELAGGIEEINFAAIELREKQEAEIKRLQSLLDKGRIGRSDFLLLVGTRVYGKTMTDYARENGLDYQTIKKRRQRVEATIQRLGKRRSP